jgi:pilus assembly protein Flp/PilA
MYQIVALMNFIATRVDAVTEKAERGATATEYAMLVAFIAVVLGVAVKVFGTALATFFSGLGAKVGIV